MTCVFFAAAVGYIMIGIFVTIFFVAMSIVILALVVHCVKKRKIGEIRHPSCYL